MIYTGVDLLTIAPILQDDIAGYKAGQPALIPVSSVDIPEEGKSKAIVKDGYIIGFHKIGSEQAITINCAGIAPSLINTLLYSESDILIDSGLNDINYFALGFRILQSDGSYTYYSYQKGTIRVNAKTIETKQGTTATVESITFLPAVTKHNFAYNGKPSRKIEINTTSHVVNVAGWLAMAWTPDSFLPVPQPKIEVEEIKKDEEFKVALLTARESDTIYYTTDGTTPTIESAQYTAPIIVNKQTVIKAIECAKSKHTSAVVVKEIENIKVKQPMIVKKGIVTDPFLEKGIVELTCDTQNAQIYYTLDGAEPSKFSNVYTNELSFYKNATVKAIAVKEGFISSEISKDTIKVKLPNAENYYNKTIFNNETVIINLTVNLKSIYGDSCECRYTLDGTEPTEATSNILRAGEELIIKKNCLFKAIMTANNNINSDIITIKIATLKAEKPVITAWQAELICADPTFIVEYK